MRLIDADAIKGPIELQRASYERIGATERAEAYANVLWEIDEAPTVGEWVSVKDNGKEDDCGKIQKLDRDDVRTFDG